MSDTPKVRRDKRCYVCKGERPFTPQKGVPFEAYLGDPFCSSACARKYWHTREKPHPAALGDPGRHRGKGIRLKRSKHS